MVVGFLKNNVVLVRTTDDVVPVRFVGADLPRVHTQIFVCVLVLFL